MTLGQEQFSGQKPVPNPFLEKWDGWKGSAPFASPIASLSPRLGLPLSKGTVPLNRWEEKSNLIKNWLCVKTVRMSL